MSSPKRRSWSRRGSERGSGSTSCRNDALWRHKPGATMASAPSNFSFAEQGLEMVATSSRSLVKSLDTIEKDLGLSESELASALGVTVHHLQGWRRGDAAPSQDALQ